jgi:3-hydroxyacyl-[acyl-carrier-protein] dehydratase
MRFILVDKILDLDPGKSIRAVKQLPSSEELFLDHFPGFPVVPGVLLTEMMGQAAGKCLVADGSRTARPMLGKINNASFRRWVRPDEEIILHATIKQNRRQYAIASCTAEVGGESVATAELFFVFPPGEQLAPDAGDPVLEAYWRTRPSSEEANASAEPKA